MCVVKIVRVHENSLLPTRASKKSAGIDLYSCEDVIISKRGQAVIDTGIRVQLPLGCYGRIAPRSGLTVFFSLDVGAGVIDEDYCGIIKVSINNIQFK